MTLPSDQLLLQAKNAIIDLVSPSVFYELDYEGIEDEDYGTWSY